MNAGISLILIIVLSFVVASMLNVYPLTPIFAMLRPMFLIMVLIFWVMYQPRFVGMGAAFLSGLAADLLLDTHLGHQAFCAVVMAFALRMAVSYSRRITFATAWTLAMVSLSLYCVMLWVLQSIAYTQLVFMGIGSLLSSILLFPVVWWLLLQISYKAHKKAS
ncbi:MAG: rod shape-determining protein MreD [Moraxella sp.]|nr:rod shape-determining protein MreD [Moraxella sp.]